MRIIICFFMLGFLLGCQSAPQGDSEFYTWVDETGQIRTIKKPEPSKTSNGQATGSNARKNNSFDSADFTPSEDVDKKLNNEKLFAWQDTSGAQVVVEEGVTPSIEIDHSVSAQKVAARDFRVFRLGTQIELDQINGVSINLERYYQFNPKAGTDFLLIEFLEPVVQLEVKSFIHNDTVAIPRIIPLTSNFTQKDAFESPFKYRESETWYRYGFLYGTLNMPQDTRYLLLLPSPESGAFEIDGRIIKQSNLGSLVFTRQ